MSFMAWSATKSTAKSASSCARTTTASAATSISAPGNYNPTTARLYTDTGLLTCQPDFGEDASNVFNLLTGIGHFQAGQENIVVAVRIAPADAGIDRARSGKRAAGPPARIIAKMNALVDGEIIEALYRASQAGVKIDLLVRGICCLRPGLPGREREHHGAQHCGPVSGAQPHFLF